MRLIGLTGKREIGKSEVARWLVEAGFTSCHALGGGRAAAEAYFTHIGATPDGAHRMVYGDLKDVPSDLLPGRVTPRDFLEPFGKFMGNGLGPEWTLGLELRRMRRLGIENVVVESLVYEADIFRAAGGTIVRIVRPGHEGPTGAETDKVQALIKEDVLIVNDGALDDLKAKVLALI